LMLFPSCWHLQKHCSIASSCQQAAVLKGYRATRFRNHFSNLNSSSALRTCVLWYLFSSILSGAMVISFVSLSLDRWIRPSQTGRFWWCWWFCAYA
jgi:hypothetical protein